MPTNKQLQDAQTLLAAFDWSKADAMSDEEILAAARSDLDSALPTDDELAEFRLVTTTRGGATVWPPGQAAE